jgi:hypothetical protein
MFRSAGINERSTSVRSRNVCPLKSTVSAGVSGSLRSRTRFEDFCSCIGDLWRFDRTLPTSDSGGCDSDALAEMPDRARSLPLRVETETDGPVVLTISISASSEGACSAAIADCRARVCFRFGFGVGSDPGSGSASSASQEGSI